MLRSLNKIRIILALSFLLIFFCNVNTADAAVFGVSSKGIPSSGINTGLVGWWTFDGGTMALRGNAIDVSGNNNTGYMTNISTSTFYTQGKIGQAYNFDGLNDYVSVTDAASLNPTTVSMSAWVKTSSTGGYIIAKDPPLESVNYFKDFKNSIVKLFNGLTKTKAPEEPEKLTHLRFDPSGRTFSTTKSNQYVYKTKIGQKNVKLANGEYVPYVWESDKKVLRFADASVHFNDNKMEFWNEVKKVHEVSLFPEINIEGNWKKEVATVSNVRVEETKTVEATDYISISYDLETENQKSTISMRVGGESNAQFAFDTLAKREGVYRLAVEHDLDGLLPVYASEKNTKTQLIGYQNPDNGFYWRWIEDEENHNIKRKDDLGTLAVLLNEDEYKPGETNRAFPDTWGTDVGITETGDDGYIDDNNYNFSKNNPTVSIGVSGIGYGWDVGLRWQNITIAPGSTILSTLIKIYWLSNTGTIASQPIYAWDTDNATVFDDTTHPFSGIPATTATASFSISSPSTVNEWKTSPDLSAITQEIINRVGWASGNSINYYTSYAGSLGNHGAFSDYSNADTNQPTLTITYEAQTPKTNVPYALSTVNGGQFLIKSGASTYTVDSSVSVADGKWHHIASTYDGTTMRVYVDGVQTGSGTSFSGNLPTQAGNVRIGADYSTTPNNFFKGVIDDARIYNRVLSINEILLLYRQGAGAKAATSVKSPLGSGLSSGLVGNWTFDGKDILNGVVLDKSGTGNNGNPIGIASSTFYAEGAIGQGVNFDGANDYLRVPDHSSLQVTLTTPFSLSFWFKIPAKGSANQSIATKFNGFQGYRIYTSSSDAKLYFVISNIDLSFQITSANALNDGEWHYATVMYSGNSNRTGMSMYIDELPAVVGADSEIAATISNTSIFYLGTSYTAGNQFLKGYLDGVRYYNRVLSESEIRQLYRLGAGTKIASTAKGIPSTGLNSGLVSWWTFDGKDISNGLILDKGTNGNHGRPMSIASSTFYSIGKIGQGITLDQSNDYIDIGSNTVLTTGQPFSISWWEKITDNSKITDASADYPSRFNFDVSGSTRNFLVIRARSNATYTPITFGNAASVPTFFAIKVLTAPSVSAGIRVWNHYVITGSDPNSSTASDFLFYHNGVSLTTSTGGPFGAATGNRIGLDGAGDSAAGTTLDDVRVYNRRLSAQEVVQLYRQGR